MPLAFSSPARSPPRQQQHQRHGHAVALPPPPGHHRRTLSSTLVEESVADAAALVQKWHPDAVSSSSSLFLLHDDADDDEAQGFLRAAAELHRAMLFFSADTTNPYSQSGLGLVQAQALLQTAMRRLQLELQFLLDNHDDAIVDGDEESFQQQQQAKKSIRSVAKSMMAAGYGKECVFTYKSHRRTSLSTKLHRLIGFSPPDSSSSSFSSFFQKLSWEQIDGKIIPSWITAATVAFTTLFTAEKHLCDTVFSDNPTVRSAVFAAVADDHAMALLAVAEAAVARARRTPERLFRVLDVHDALTDVLPALLSVFGGEDNNSKNNNKSSGDVVVAGKAASVVAKVVEAARSTLSGFENAIHKEPVKAVVAGGGVHPLTRYVMNYLVFLADYHHGLALIYDHDQQPAADDTAVVGNVSPESYSSSSMSSSSLDSYYYSYNTSNSSSLIHRLVTALMGKLEAKAGSYREVALSYLFLANNTKYMATKVMASDKLKAVLGGDEWAAAQSGKARAHVDVYVRAAWGKAIAAISSDEPEGVEAAVMAAVGVQDQWVAADDEMGKALAAAATAAVVPKYRIFYRRHGAKVRLTPGDVTTMIAALFGGTQATTTTWHQPLQRHLEDPNSNTNQRRPQQLFT